MATSNQRSRRKTVAASSSTPVSTEERRRMITEAAYYLAEHRGFSAGSAEADWLQAEREIDRALQAAQTTAADSRAESRTRRPRLVAPLSDSANR